MSKQYNYIYMHFKNNFIRIFFLFAILINWNNLFSQSEEKNTELLIVGTVHFGNPNITEETIYNELTKYQPDIILWEYHKDFKPLWGLPIVNKLTHIVNKLKIEKFQMRCSPFKNFIGKIKQFLLLVMMGL